MADGNPAVIKDKNIGSRLVSRVRDICQRRKYNPNIFPEMVREYELAQKRRLKSFPDGLSKINDLEDILQAIWALFEHYAPKTLIAWEEIVNKIFKDSDYDSPISLYSIHTGKGGEGQVSFILCPDQLPLKHPKQVEEERAQEENLLYVALTRTLADGETGSGILYLVIAEDDKEDTKGGPKYPAWLPASYRTLKVAAKSSEGLLSDDDASWGYDDERNNAPEDVQRSGEGSEANFASEVKDSHPQAETHVSTSEDIPQQPALTRANNCSALTTILEPETETEARVVGQLVELANNCSSLELDLLELEEKIRRGFNLTRDFYDCGKALTLVRDREPPLYYPEFANFEEYCLKRFGKSVRQAQYFMSAAAVVDNLLEASCAVIPTAESQVRVIASLPASQQVEIWQRACEITGKGKVPTAVMVKQAKAEVLGEPLLDAPAHQVEVIELNGVDETVQTGNQGTSTPISMVPKYNVLPDPAILLEQLKGRSQGSKASLEDVEILLELVLDLTQHEVSHLA